MAKGSLYGVSARDSQEASKVSALNNLMIATDGGTHGRQGEWYKNLLYGPALSGWVVSAKVLSRAWL